MNNNFSDFIDPISPTEPAGKNIEYDSRFLDIQSIAEGKPEQQYGEVIIEAEEPDWSAIEKLSIQLLSESKDLRVLCFYTQALTANYGLVGFQNGCEIIATNLTKYWEEMYPPLIDDDGEYDPYFRVNAISLLLSEHGVINQLNSSNLLYSASKKSYISLKYATSIITNNTEQSYPGGRDKFIQDLKVAFQAKQDDLLAINNALIALNKIESLYNENLEAHSLNFMLLKEPLEYLSNIFSESQKIDNGNSDTQTSKILEKDKLKNEETSAVEFDWQNLEVTNRSEVDVILEKIILYFRIHEPSHPAPLFIKRVKKLMNMSFYEIVKDVSPSSLADLELLIGKDEEADIDINEGP